MDVSFTIRVAVLLIVTFVYMMFDLFNKRNVPSLFAYGSLVIGLIMTLLYLDFSLITESLLIAIIIGAIGYLFFKSGQIGAADVIEFAAISLMLPLQQPPILLLAQQFNMPFIISVFIAAGLVSLVIVPIYYIPRAERVLKKPILSLVSQKDMLKGSLLLVAYLGFIAFLIYQVNASMYAILALLVMMFGSIATIVFERPITDSMVKFISVNDFEEEDIIAFNLMPKKEIDEIKKKVKEFDRLITKDVIKDLKEKHIETKFPVYKEAIPLALPIFLGTVLSLLLGNLLLLIL